MSAEKKYNSNKLRNVVARVDFVSKISHIDSELPQSALNFIKLKFPIAESMRGQQLQINTQVNPNIHKEEFATWNFHGENREKTLSITPYYLTISYSQYQSYKDFKIEFIDSVSKLFEGKEQESVKRIGLRYINIFDNFTLKEDLNIANYIQEKYLNQQMINMDATCSRLINVIEHSYDDKSKSRIQYGFFNPNYPAPIKNHSFILDCDAYTDYLINLADIDKTFDILHQVANNVFEDFITDKTKVLLDGK